MAFRSGIAPDVWERQSPRMLETAFVELAEMEQQERQEQQRNPGGMGDDGWIGRRRRAR